MSETAKQLLRQILELSPEERDDLLDEVERADGGRYDLPPDSYPDDDAWAAELQRRSDSVADGTAELLDGEQVFRELRDKLKRMREGQDG